MKKNSVIKLVAVSVFVIWSLAPILYAVEISFTGPFMPGKLLELPPLSLEHWSYITSYRPIWPHFITSFQVASLTTVLCIFVTFPSAYAFSRYKSAGTSTLLNVYLFLRMLPSAGIVIPIFVLWARYKILNTIFGLSLAHLVTAIPMAVWLMKGFFDQVPFEVEESAFVDGASRLTTLFRITLPMALPGVAVTALMVFFGSYIELFFAVILMGINKPLPAYIASFVTEHRMFWQEMMASSILSMIPMLVYFSLLQKYMLRGIYLVGTGGR